MSSAIVAVAVLGKKNNPIFFRTSQPDPDYALQFLVHSSVDVIEEKVSGVKKDATDLRDPFLGALYPHDQFRIFGYMTNSLVKFVIVVESAAAFKEPEIRGLHDAYLRLVCNPFYKPEDNVTSKRFEASIKSMLDTTIMPAN